MCSRTLRTLPSTHSCESMLALNMRNRLMWRTVVEADLSALFAIHCERSWLQYADDGAARSREQRATRARRCIAASGPRAVRRRQSRRADLAGRRAGQHGLIGERSCSWSAARTSDTAARAGIGAGARSISAINTIARRRVRCCGCAWRCSLCCAASIPTPVNTN